MNRSFLLMGTAAVCILTAGVLLLAGRTSYWQAWVFGAVNLAIVISMARGLSDNPDIHKKRMKLGRGAKWWDVLFLALFGPMNLAIIVAAALDAGRFGWSGPAPVFAVPLAYTFYAFSAAIHLWAVRTNIFYIGTVRVLKDHGHRVVDTGPYRYVRHPGYIGIILMVNSMAIVLGSFAALVPSGIVTLLVIGRTALEDRFLARELEGYDEYRSRVRFRLIPGVW